MRIEVLFTPAVPASVRLAGGTAVVVDALRASATIVEALAAGATEVVPVAEVAEALALAGPGVVVGGERGAQRCDGFDLGNSPREYTPAAVAGRRVVLCTTNGTRAIEAAHRQGAATLLVAAFSNLKAVVGVAAAAGRDVTVVCAGREGEFSLEDAALAGGLVAGLAYRLGPAAERTDAALAAEALFRMHRADLVRLFASAAHGRALIDLGFGEDLAVCARLNTRTVVPALAAAEGGRPVLRPYPAP
ncbi:MAG TPA: 2-phosphosulfolactate phosphatase [Thermodesulfobacteriota bacterium]|nr:2-phosphosulfolactate phosphatase [Thermodesulfobacteriota bacterium]